MILVEIAGFLGADPEERFTATGKRVVSLRIATRVRKGGQDETVWWRVNIWDDRFDKMLPHLKKGSAVIVIGEMAKPETYTSKEGIVQVSLTITAEMIKFSPFGRPDRPESQSQSTTTSDQFANRSQGVRESAPQEYTHEYAGAGLSADGGLTGDDLPF